MKTRALLFVVVAAGGAAIATIPAPPAQAAGEREFQTSLRAGAGTVNIDGRRPWGWAFGLDLEFGLTDSWALRSSFEYTRHGVTAEDMEDMRPSGTVYTMAALGGLTYTFDVLRLVPYAIGQLGVIRFDGAVVVPQNVFAAQLGVGADYFLTRRWIAGVAFQYLFAPADLAADPLNLGSSPFCFSTTLRAGRVF